MSKNKIDMELVKEKFELNEDHHLDPADESKMAKKQLATICKNVEALKLVIGEGTQIDAWVQSKLAIADSHIQEITNYMEAEADETPDMEGVPEPGMEGPEMGAEVVDTEVEDLEGAPSPEGQDLDPEMGVEIEGEEEIDLSPVEDIFPMKGSVTPAGEEGPEEEIEAEEEIEDEEGGKGGVIAGSIAVKESLESYLQ